MPRFIVACVLAVSSVSVFACPPATWQELVDAAKIDEARVHCTALSSSASLDDRVAAEICFANLALYRNDVIVAETLVQGGAILRPGYRKEAVDEAVKHLAEGLKLRATEVCVHQGRMHLLLRDHRFSQALAALAEGMKALDVADELELWLSYAPYFDTPDAMAPAVEYHRLLEEQFDDHRISANIGAYLSLQGKDEEALPYVAEAARLKPDDRINVWNHARLLDYMGRPDDARPLYERALTLPMVPGSDSHDNQLCIYAQFLQRTAPDDPRRAEVGRGCEEPRQQ